MPRKLVIPNKSLTPGWERGKQDTKTVQSEIQYRTDMETIERWGNDLTASSGPWESGTGVGSAELIGATDLAQGDFSVSEGSNTQAILTGDHAEGTGTHAEGPGAHAEGDLTAANNIAAHAEGHSTIATAIYSHAEGDGTQVPAGGNAGHAEGFQTTAGILPYAHAENELTTASGRSSHAEGFTTVASGSYSHTEGYQSQATGQASHGEGMNTVATGEGSHAEGTNTKAAADYSHAGGAGGVTFIPAQFAQGSTSDPDRTQYSNVTFRRFTIDATPSLMLDANNIGCLKFDTFNETAHFVIYVVARRTDVVGTNSVWKIEGVVAGNGVNSYRFVGVPTTTLIAQDAGAAAWAVAIAWDLVILQQLNITVTGAAGESIFWSATVHLHEVI